MSQGLDPNPGKDIEDVTESLSKEEQEEINRRLSDEFLDDEEG